MKGPWVTVLEDIPPWDKMRAAMVEKLNRVAIARIEAK